MGGRLGITQQQLSKYEKGQNRISASRLDTVLKILGISPADFFDLLGSTTIALSDDITDRERVKVMKLYNAAPFECRKGIMHLLEAINKI